VVKSESFSSRLLCMRLMKNERIRDIAFCHNVREKYITELFCVSFSKQWSKLESEKFKLSNHVC
jgi:hypothetical protein